MTIIDEILICANKIANAGKKPTVALVKAKLTQRVPLATLITTLKSWQHQPDFIVSINNEEEQVNQDSATKSTSALVDSLFENDTMKKLIQQSLTLEFTEIKNELSEMKLLITKLTEQLSKK